MRIYLWGPSGTGKTWLVDAFIRKLNLIDDILIRMPQPSFSLWMEDRLVMRQYRYTLEAKRTIDINYQEFTLHREYLEGKQNTVSRLACTHTHQLMMLDGPGDETTGELAVTVNTEKNRAKVLAAHEALIDSDYLIICAERGLRNEPPYREIAGIAYVEQLKNLLSLPRNSSQQVVVCFTKSDLYGNKDEDFDKGLVRLFGKFGHEVGDILREFDHSRKTPPYFYVSAVGYCHNSDGEVVPNFDGLTNKLIKPEHWNPEDVESPFFWIFTDAEIRLLNNIKVAPNLPSYMPKFLSSLINKSLADSLRRDLISAYISYDDMIRQSKI